MASRDKGIGPVPGQAVGCPRRTVLVGAGLAGLAGAAAFLPGCSGGAARSEAGRTPSARPAGAGTGDGALATVAEVPVGGGKLVTDRGTPVLLAQPTAGVVRAYNAICPHLGVLVAEPRDGVIPCTAHGSRFRTDDGGLLQGPATRGLTALPVRVSGGRIFLA